MPISSKSPSQRRHRLSLLFLGALARAAIASSFYENGQEGWFWYRELHDLSTERRIPIPKRSEGPSAAGPSPFSTAWLKKQLPKFRERAIDDPSPENVAAFFALQRLAFDKAERFAKTASLLPVLYPKLDENLRRPQASFAAGISDRMAEKARDEALSRIAQVAGVFFFFRSDCPHCHAQAELLKVLEHRYGFSIFPISVDGLPLAGYPDYRIDQGQAEALGVAITPALFLVNPEARAERIQLIAQGALALPDLKQRIVDVAFKAGWIDRKTYEATLPVRPLYLLPESSPRELSDPKEVLNVLGIEAGSHSESEIPDRL